MWVFLVLLTQVANASYRFTNNTILNNGACKIQDNNLDEWRDTDRVEVYLAEYELQHFGLSGWLGFSTAHMGVVFQNPRINKWYVIDSFAESGGTIASIIMPSVAPESEWNNLNFIQRIFSYFRGEIINSLVWENKGLVRMLEHRTDEYQDLVHLGATSAIYLKNVREWIINKYTRDDPFTFDMWQIYNASTNERLRKSRMCHDLVEDILQMLALEMNDGELSVFRDSLNLNVTSWEELDMTSGKSRRDYQRFFRFFKNHVYEATREMSFTRIMLAKFIKLKIPFILFLDGKRYFRATLADYSVINYCRMPLEMTQGQPFVPAKLDDPRQHCSIQRLDVEMLEGKLSFTIFDIAIWIEQIIDDAISDGSAWSYLIAALESTAVVIALARFARRQSLKTYNQS